MSNKGKGAYVYMYGTGWGSQVAELLAEQGYTIIGMWSYDEVELRRVAEKLNIEFYTTDKDELLNFQQQKKKSNLKTLVWVATPPFQLAHITKEILTLGYNIVVEAPGASSVEEAASLYKGATQFATWLCRCPYQLRNLPAVIRLNNIISDKKFGAVRSIEVRIQCNQTAMCSQKYNWKHDRNRCGGALNMFGCHIIDLLLYLLNEPKVEAVQGTMSTFVRTNHYIKGIREITADDVCNFQLKFSSHKSNHCFANDSIVAWVHISMLHPDTVFKQEITIITENAALVLDNCKLDVIPYQCNMNSPLTKEELEEKPRFTCDNLPPGSPTPYILGMKYFIHNLDLHKLSPFNDDCNKRAMLELLQHVMKVLEKIRESSDRRERCWISVETKCCSVNDPKTKSNSARGSEFRALGGEGGRGTNARGSASVGKNKTSAQRLL